MRSGGFQVGIKKVRSEKVNKQLQLLSLATVAQRLVRAKRRIKASRIRFSVPDRSAMPARLPPVLEAVYGCYAIAWSSTADPGQLRRSMAGEARYLAVALAAFPLCWRVLRGLPDRGYAAAKTLGLLIVGYVAWLLPSLRLMEFGRGAVTRVGKGRAPGKRE